MDEIFKTKKRVIAENPQVSQKELQKIDRLMKQLRAAGVKRAEYDIAPPYSREIFNCRDSSGTSEN